MGHSRNVEGRKQGQGWWLEERSKEAFNRWGYDAATNGYVWGQEIDVVARRPESQISYIGQCKDYDSAKITPCTMWRLIALSYTTGSWPVIVTDSELTGPARQIARMWRVRVISTDEVVESPTIPQEQFPDPDIDQVPDRHTNPAWRPHNIRSVLLPNNFHEKMHFPRY